MAIQLNVPDIGDFEQVEIVEVIVKVGEKIKKNDPVVTLESDKSSVEVPSTHEGTVKAVNVKVGDKVSKGHLLAILSSENQVEKKPIKNLEEKKSAGVVKEDSFRNPKTMYGCNKLYCEHLGNYYTNNYQRLGAIEQHSCIDFRSIRFPGIISSKTIPTAGTSDFIPEMLHAAAKGEAV